MGKIEVKDEENKNNGKEVVLKVNIHCEGCGNKVFKCLNGFDGAEDIVIDSANHRVIVKGKNVDPMKLLGRLQKKYSKHVELISPKPKIDYPKDKINAQKKEEIKTVVLKMYIHCEGCAIDIKRSIGKMEGVIHVEVNMEKSLVMVKGLFDPPKLVEKITKRMGKYVEIVNKEGEEKRNDHQENEIKEEILIYPSCYNVKSMYPYSLLSDENIFSCSIM